MCVLVTLQYNESTLLLVLKHMIYSLTHPTPPLEALTREHFRRRAPAIIRRCQRILDKTPSAGATTTTHASSTPATCSRTAGAAGGGSGVGGGSSAGVGIGEEQESGERAEDGANDNVTDHAVGWADRSFAFSVDPTARMLKRVCVTRECIPLRPACVSRWLLVVSRRCVTRWFLSHDGAWEAERCTDAGIVRGDY